MDGKCFIVVLCLGLRSSTCSGSLQVTRIDRTVDSPPCLKVTHKTFGTQNSNCDMVYCRLSMPVEFYSADMLLDESLKLRSDVSPALGLTPRRLIC